MVHTCTSSGAALAGLWNQLTRQPSQSVFILDLLNAPRLSAFRFLESLCVALNQAVDQTRGQTSDPDDIVVQAQSLGYEVTLLPDPNGSPAHLAALLVRQGPGVSAWSHRLVNNAARHVPKLFSNAVQQSFSVPSRTQSALITALRNTVAGQLPGPMCSTHYMVARELPPTPAFTIDRSGLPPPGCARPMLSGDLVAPRDTLELQLTRLIGKTLGMNSVGAFPGSTGCRSTRVNRPRAARISTR